MFNSIISLCERHGLLRKIVFQKLKFEQLKVGPTGSLLLQNLKNEWFYNIVTNKDNSVFLSDNNSFQETLQFAKQMCSHKLPFGVAEIIQSKKYSTEEELIDAYDETKKHDHLEFQTLFGNDDRCSLKCSMFVSSSDSTPFFHQWQRQRRIWWRRFSPNPGRYSMTDIKTEDKNVQSVQIVAKYPWNNQVVETLVFYPFLHPKLKASDNNFDFKFKDGKKNLQCHTIVSNVDLSTMFINAICDAFEESEYKGTKRTLLRFHRKLAPYKISFAISSSGVAAITSELNDLALYLTKQLRANHISTMFLPSSSKLSLEAQWRQYDELGIPYNVLLNEKTLKDGLLLLRSRDTNLKEQVHVTDLVPYVEKLFKNY